MGNGQTKNAEYVTKMQHPNNYRTVPLGTNKEGDWLIRGHVYVDSIGRA